MRILPLVLMLAIAASLLAQSSSSYRVTHTYTLGGDGELGLHRARSSRITVCSSPGRIA